MLLQVKDLSKSFGDKRVLSGVGFEAQSGQAFGLLGRNGAGKTTTIRIIMGVINGDAGEVLIDGEPIDRKKVSIGYLPEERGLYARKKIIDQLVYFARLKGMKQADAVAACDRWLERLGMGEYRNKRLDTLSKGNQQKIQLITALVHNPDIVILDEPFSGLDPVNAGLLRDVVNEEMAAGKIVLFSSHQMNYVEEFCRHIALIDGGQVVLAGDLRDIKRSYPRNRLMVRSREVEQMVDFVSPEDPFPGEGVGSAECVGPDELLVTLNNPGDKSGLMLALVSTFDIDEIKVMEPTLNDIFVATVGKE